PVFGIVVAGAADTFSLHSCDLEMATLADLIAQTNASRAAREEDEDDRRPTVPRAMSEDEAYLLAIDALRVDVAVDEERDPAEESPVPRRRSARRVGRFIGRMLAASLAFVAMLAVATDAGLLRVLADGSAPRSVENARTPIVYVRSPARP